MNNRCLLCGLVIGVLVVAAVSAAADDVNAQDEFDAALRSKETNRSASGDAMAVTDAPQLVLDACAVMANAVTLTVALPLRYQVEYTRLNNRAAPACANWIAKRTPEMATSGERAKEPANKFGRLQLTVPFSEAISECGLTATKESGDRLVYTGAVFLRASEQLDAPASSSNLGPELARRALTFVLPFRVELQTVVAASARMTNVTFEYRTPAMLKEMAAGVLTALVEQSVGVVNEQSLEPHMTVVVRTRVHGPFRARLADSDGVRVLGSPDSISVVPRGEPTDLGCQRPAGIAPVCTQQFTFDVTRKRPDVCALRDRVQLRWRLECRRELTGDACPLPEQLPVTVGGAAKEPAPIVRAVMGLDSGNVCATVIDHVLLKSRLLLYADEEHALAAEEFKMLSRVNADLLIAPAENDPKLEVASAELLEVRVRPQAENQSDAEADRRTFFLFTRGQPRDEEKQTGFTHQDFHSRARASGGDIEPVRLNFSFLINSPPFLTQHLAGVYRENYTITALANVSYALPPHAQPSSASPLAADQPLPIRHALVAFPLPPDVLSALDANVRLAARSAPSSCGWEGPAASSRFAVVSPWAAAPGKEGEGAAGASAAAAHSDRAMRIGVGVAAGVVGVAGITAAALAWRRRRGLSGDAGAAPV